MEQMKSDRLVVRLRFTWENSVKYLCGFFVSEAICYAFDDFKERHSCGVQFQNFQNLEILKKGEGSLIFFRIFQIFFTFLNLLKCTFSYLVHVG